MDFSASASCILYSQVYVTYAEYGGCSREANVINKSEMYRGSSSDLRHAVLSSRIGGVPFVQ